MLHSFLWGAPAGVPVSGREAASQGQGQPLPGFPWAQLREAFLQVVAAAMVGPHGEAQGL